MYNNLILAHEGAARKHIPLKNKVKQHVPWENENITESSEGCYPEEDKEQCKETEGC
jgi:hypothetical protein